MLRVRVCGGLELEADGRSLPDALVGGRQGRLVLAYLLCERPRAVRREELAELLWADQLPDSWTASLSAVISRLRKLLTEAGLDGAEAIVSAAGSYELVLPPDTVMDLDELEKAVETAEAAAGAGDVAQVTEAASVAESIASRGFLKDDCDWVDRQRDLVRDLRVRATLALSSGHLAAGAAGRAVEAARDALGLDEAREAAYRQLMRALAAAGERGEALRVWERCRTALVEELGVDPSPETEAVYLEVLAAGAPAAPEPVTTALPSGVVTFLLTDIVDSSALWDKAPAAMAVALERHDALVAEIVRDHGGTLLKSKLEGDATVSVFARASDGAAAAIALQQGVADEPWPEGAQPRLRMAMHTGEAFERGGDYFGPALNRAARLRSLAGAGEVLLSQAVTELVRDHLPTDVALRDLGHRDLRGLTRGENVFALGRATAPEGEGEPTPAGPDELTPPALPAALASDAPFVGRGGELSTLVGLWDDASGGAPGAAFIGGEPGVGKSRLAGEIAEHAHAAGALVLYGRCDEDLGAPLQPFIEALRTLVPALGATRVGSVRGVDELARVVPELAELLPDRALAVRADPDTERLALFDAVTNLLGAASAEAPVLLVLDDLHWAGKTTLSLLRHLLRAAKGARLLVVGTYRDTELARTHPLAETLADLRRDADASRISLGGLAAEDIDAYLSAVGIDDRALGRELTEVTSGNPFFLIEVLRHVEETGGTWSPGNLPEGVREATGRRLSRLSDATNRALSVAAVVGPSFDLALVEQAQGSDLVDEIAEACQAGLVVEEPGSIDRFRFAHALVRQVLLAELVTVKRVRLHKTIAELLEAAPVGIDPDARLADLAYHWSECASLGDAGKAVAACRQAADRAIERLAYEEAGDLYGMALQALDDDDPSSDTRATLHLARCDALLTAGDVASARDAIDALESAAHGSERLAAWYTTYEGLLAVLAEPDRLTEIVQSIGAAAGAMRAIGDLRGEARAHYVHASALERLGQIGAAERALDAALAAARTADDRSLADSILAEAPPAALWGPSSVTRASGRCLDVVRVLRINDGAPAVESVALRCQAVLEALRGRADAARRMIASSRRTVERLGLTHRQLETDVAAGFIELIAGDAAEAEVLLRRAYEGLRERGLGGEAAQAGAFLGRALLLQDRVDEADEVAAEAEALAGSDLKAAIAWRGVRAEAAARRGDADRALTLAREAVELAAATDALLLVVDARLALATVLRVTGDQPGADAETQRAVEACEAKGATALAVRARGAAPGLSPAEPSTAQLHRPEPAGALPRVVANEAVRGAWRFHDMFNRGALDEVPDQRHPDFRWEDRRRVLADRVLQAEEDADEQTAANTEFAYRSGAKFDPEEVLVVRGDHLALIRVGLRGPSAEWSFLIVVRTATDGRLLDYVMFDPEDRSAANAELDQLTPAELEVDNKAWQAARRFAAAGNAHDWELFLANLAPSYERLDRRTSLLHVPADTDPLEMHRTMFSLDEYAIERNLLEVVGDRRALVHDLIWFRDGATGEAEVPGISLFEVDEAGLIVHQSGFDESDLEAARAELHRGTADSIPDTRAVRTARRFVEAMNAHDWDGVTACVDPDVTFLDRRRAVTAPDTSNLLETYRVLFTLDDWSVDRTVLRTSGEDRVLVRDVVWFRTRDAADSEIESLNLYDVDDTGRIVHMISFAGDDLDAALAELGAETSGIPDTLAVRALRRYSDAINGHDWDALVAVFAPGAQQLDRRSWISTGGFVDPLEMNRTLFALDDWGTDDRPLEAHGDRRVLVQRVTRFRDGASGWADVATLTVTEVDAVGRITLHIGLDPGDLEAARAELVSVPPVPAPRENVAWTAALGMKAASDAKDWDAFVACFAAEYEYRSERPTVQLHLVGEQAPSAYRALFDLQDWTWERSLLLSRGDAIALVRDDVTFVDGTVGPGAMSSLCVVEAAPDRVVLRTVAFELDDLDAAMTELEAATSRAATSSFENEAWRASTRMWEACAARDRDALLATLAEGFEADERRRAVQLRLTGEDAIAAYLLLLELDELRWERTLRATRGQHLALTHERWTIVDRAAGDAETVLLCVITAGVDGQVLRTTTFDEDDLDAAFEELDRQYAEQGGPDQRGYVHAITHGDWDELRSYFRPDAVIVDHRFAGFDQVDLESFIAYVAPTGVDVRPGERFSIDHVVAAHPRGHVAVATDIGRHGESEYEVSLVSVTCWDADERTVALHLYDLDQLDDALRELETFVASTEAPAGVAPNAAWRAIQRLEAAFNAQDLPRLLTTLSPTYTHHDRRAGLLHDLEGDEALSVFRSGVALDEFHLTNRLLDVRGDRLALLEQQATFRDGASGPAEITTLTVIEVDGDGLMLRHIVFEPTALDEARAQLERLHAASAPTLVRNRASEFSERFVAAYNARDAEALVALHSPGYSYHDRRGTITAIDLYGVEAFGQFRFAMTMEDFHLERRLVATRGDHLALVEEHATFRTGASGLAQIDCLTVFEIDDDGLALRNIAFDPQAMDEAVAELESRHAAGDAFRPRANLAWHASVRQKQASDEVDWEAFAATFAPSFEYVDRRLAMWVRTDSDPTAIHRGMFELDEWEFRRTLLATRGERLALIRTTCAFRTGASGPAEVTTIAVNEVGADGLVVREVAFDVDQLDEAVAELDARWEATRSSEPEPNPAWELALRQVAAAAAKDWDAWVTTCHPALEYLERRRGIQPPTGTIPLAMHRTMFELDEWEFTRTLLATRGDHLALVRQGCRFRDGAAGPAASEGIAVLEVADDGRLLREIPFDPEDVDTAMAFLEARWVERQAESTGTGNTAWRTSLRQVAASDAADWDAFVTTIHPDFEYIDVRRSLWVPTQDPLEIYRTMFSLAEWRLERSLVATRGTDLALVRITCSFRDGASGLASVSALGVYETAPDGRVRRETAFDVDDVEQATAALEARWQELQAEGRERQRLLEDPLAIPRTLAVRSVEQPGWTLVSAIGEHVSLHDTGDAGTIVHEVDDAGQVMAALSFGPDRRRDAFDELVRRGYRRLDLPEGAVAIARAVLANDSAAASAWMAEDCVVEDHRRLRSGGRQDAEYVSELLGSYDSLARDHELEILRMEVPDRDPQGNLAVIRLVGTTSDGAAFENAYVSVARWNASGLLTDLAMYEPEDIELARARLTTHQPTDQIADDPLAIPRNLAARSVGKPAWTLLAALGEHLCLHDTGDRLVLHEVDDAAEVTAFLAFARADRRGAFDEVATRAFGRYGAPAPTSGMIAAMNAGDVPALRACLSDDCVIEDHRSLRVVPIESADEYAAGFTLFIELAEDYCVEMVSMDAMEPWGCITLVRFNGTASDGGAFELRTRACSTWDESGRATLMALYEPEDRDAALARLAEASPD